MLKITKIERFTPSQDEDIFAEKSEILMVSLQLRWGSCTPDHERGILAERGSVGSSVTVNSLVHLLPAGEVGPDRGRLHILVSIALPVGEVCQS